MQYPYSELKVIMFENLITCTYDSCTTNSITPIWAASKVYCEILGILLEQIDIILLIDTIRYN